MNLLNVLLGTAPLLPQGGWQPMATGLSNPKLLMEMRSLDRQSSISCLPGFNGNAG